MPIIFEDYRRKRTRRRAAIAGVSLVSVFAGVLIGVAASRSSVMPEAGMPAERTEVLEGTTGGRRGGDDSAGSAMRCSAVDGDTLDCGGGRIRLLAIDAPELPGHCRAGRNCVPGDPFAASRALGDAIAPGGMRIRPAGKDRYGRTLANVYVGDSNVACALIAGGFVQYVRRWDNDGRVASDCRLAH